MNKVIDFIKSYPIIVATIVVAIVGLVLIGLVIPSGSAFVADVEARQTVANEISTLQSSQMTIPPEKPDDPPRVVTGVVNEAAIQAKKDAYAGMKREYDAIFKTAEEYNRRGHTSMMESLFPDPPTDQAQLMKFNAKSVYIQAFLRMLAKPDPASAYPALNAGLPLEQTILDERLNQLETDFLTDLFPIEPDKRDVQNLTPEQQQNLAIKKRELFVSLLRQHAGRIHIYADNNRKSPDFPFHVGTWSEPGTAPEMRDLWEGQMGLWIQQDIVRAIGMTNGVGQPDTNVMNAPIKRLIKITVPQVYVGRNGQGMLFAAGGRGAPTPRQNVGLPQRNIRPTAPPGRAPAPGAGARPSGTLDEAAYATQTPGLQVQQTNTQSADKPLEDDFKISHTGRKSNPIYDVRQVEVRLHMSTSHLNAFINNLAKVNFMTVLKATIVDVDEYEELTRGYMYGGDDVAEVTLLIESVWLRNWTSQLMPEQVKLDLGVLTVKDDDAAKKP